MKIKKIYYKKICTFDIYIEFSNNLIISIYLNLIGSFKTIDNRKNFPDEVNLCFEYIDKILSDESIKINFNIFDFSNLSEFQKKVLFTLYKKVDFSKTVSYKKLAELSGFKRAYRAVGSVMKKNRFPIIFPCHRVIKKNGSLGGFSAGLELKKKLLDNEKI